MKAIASRVICCLFLTIVGLSAQTITWTNFIRQVQNGSGVQWDVSVGMAGTRQSAYGVEPGGVRYELWTIKSSPLTSYLLDTRSVGIYPTAKIVFITDDPYATIPRTRADQPIKMALTIGELSSLANAPIGTKSVRFLHHTQSYGTGDGININRSQATLTEQISLNQNATTVFTYPLTTIAGADRTKIRGEERFSVFSVADSVTPEAQLASSYIQVWPVATAVISGINDGDTIKGKVPAISVALGDLYPDSRTYVQVYKGGAVLGTSGTLVPGMALIINDTIPRAGTLSGSNWDAVFGEDGTWTIEVLTSTPFGIDRLDKVTFTLDQNLKVNGTVTTME